MLMLLAHLVLSLKCIAKGDPIEMWSVQYEFNSGCQGMEALLHLHNDAFGLHGRHCQAHDWNYFYKQ